MLKELSRSGDIVSELLWEMDNYHWSSISNIPQNNVETIGRLDLFGNTANCFGMKTAGSSLHFDATQIIRHSGLILDGSILEFDVGSTSKIGGIYSDYVALDNDPRIVKFLRRKGIKAIIGTIEDLPFPKNSFDYVLAFSPLIVRENRGLKKMGKESNHIELTPDYKEEIVGRAIEIARKKALIASVPIAIDPPIINKAEKIVADHRQHYYYVVYRIK